MIFYILLHLDQIIIDTYISAEVTKGIKHIFTFGGTGEEAKLFQGNKDTIGEQASEHKKTSFRFWGNRRTSQIISEEQRNR